MAPTHPSRSTFSYAWPLVKSSVVGSLGELPIIPISFSLWHCVIYNVFRVWAEFDWFLRNSICLKSKWMPFLKLLEHPRQKPQSLLFLPFEGSQPPFVSGLKFLLKWTSHYLWPVASEDVSPADSHASEPGSRSFPSKSWRWLQPWPTIGL